MPFRIALSGLHSSSTDLKTTGNNIANSETTGFKASRAEFVDVYASAYGAIASVTNGSGTKTANIRQMFSQGNVEFTDNSTDLAITGQGFFVVEDDKGRYLTRNGAFGLDRDGYVTNSTGQTLQIFPAVTNGTNTTFNTGSLVDLQLNNTVGAPVSTTEMTINVNVDANSTPFNVAAGAAPAIYDHTALPIPFDVTDPSTFHHVTATTVYDSLGASHVAQMYFRKADDGGGQTGSWQVVTFVDGSEVTPSGDAAGRAALLEFNTDGTLKEVSGGPVAAGAGDFEMPFSAVPVGSGAAPISFKIDFRKLTQFGSDFAVNELSQNGFSTGRLTGFDVEDNGVVYARFTNGNAETLGMVAVANVANPQGLGQTGDSLWVETNGAGDTVLGEPGTASLGLIQAGALESSTTELSDELVNMIVSQRNYQANAQVISTADQLTQTLLNIR